MLLFLHKVKHDQRKNILNYLPLTDEIYNFGNLNILERFNGTPTDHMAIDSAPSIFDVQLYQNGAEWVKITKELAFSLSSLPSTGQVIIDIFGPNAYWKIPLQNIEWINEALKKAFLLSQKKSSKNTRRAA